MALSDAAQGVTILGVQESQGGVPVVFLTPPEIQHQPLKGGRGYAREGVDALLEEVTSSYEQVWLERDELRSRVTELERELASFREAEHVLTETLVTAQRAAEDVRSKAEKEAEQFKEQALAGTRSAKLEAERELDDVRAEIERLRALDRKLRSNLLATLEAFVREIDEPGALQPGPATLVDALAPEARNVKRDDG
jgi:cell division initiation protein